MTKQTVFVTARGLFHQQSALRGAPADLHVTMLRQPDPATLMEALRGASYFISERTGLIDADLIATAPQLQLIQRLGSLTHDIDLAAAQAAGIAVCYWPIESVILVAEHIIMQLLALAKKLREMEAITLAASDQWRDSKRTDEDTFAYNWSGRRGVGQLWQRRVGILGFGEIGVEVARRLQTWGCYVSYSKRQQLPEAVEADLQITYGSAEQLAAESDYLINLLPYFPETDQLLNEAVFATMKPGACMVSCGSGSVIDEAALAAAIERGHLGGAALDTFEWEPIRRDNPLIALAKSGHNVLLTPHTAAGTVDAAAVAQHRRQDYTNIINHLQGRPLQYRVI